MKKKVLGLMAVMALAGALAVGCGSSDKGTTEATTTEAATTEAAAE